MANLNSEIKNILTDLENKISDKETLEYVKIQIFNLYNILFDEVSNLEQLANSRIAELAQNQLALQEKIDEISKGLRNIEKDIYDEEDDDEYDFSITCPYCNNDFVLELDEMKEEVNCPECNNTIELDWGEDCDCHCDCGDECDCGEDCNCEECSIDEDEDM